MRCRFIAILLALLGPLGMSVHADAATPIHVCGIVTEYFVSDIPSGGLIEIDGKNYPIASSASYRRTLPLPDVKVGADICLDGTVNEAGDLLDFTITPRGNPSPSLPATAARSPAPEAAAPASEAPSLVLPFAAAVLVLAAGAALVLLGIKALRH